MQILRHPLPTARWTDTWYLSARDGLRLWHMTKIESMSANGYVANATTLSDATTMRRDGAMRRRYATTQWIVVSRRDEPDLYDKNSFRQVFYTLKTPVFGYPHRYPPIPGSVGRPLSFQGLALTVWRDAGAGGLHST